MAAKKRRRARGRPPPKPPTREPTPLVQATRERRKRIQPNPPYVLDAKDVEEIVYDVARRSGFAGQSIYGLTSSIVGDDYERCLAILYMGDPVNPLTLSGNFYTEDIESVVCVLAHDQVARMAKHVLMQRPPDLVSLRRPIPMTIDQYLDAVEAFANTARNNFRGMDPAEYAELMAFRHPLVNLRMAGRHGRGGYPYRAIDVLHVTEQPNALFELSDPIIEPDTSYRQEFADCSHGGEGDCVRWPAAAAFLADTLAELKGFRPRYPVAP